MNDNSNSTVSNGKATAAVILGILSIVTIVITGLGIILGVIGLILGIIGLKEINRFKQEGRKTAVAGIICSSFGILLPIFLIVISYIAFMNPTSS
ncbi:DUF4190 domain-containing protein [Salibacterium salarium]|uniref:DUF4190 domain-containing protein n=1 Tax=Salibacterium salarium TaxID=284579 RepID=A0A3R9P6U8_9BACI|nr:DUF4190 domain-containing protein [Salibacterium salarium]RSL34056.1 DUF4190 domain-containing protein [Salibacterium salarium]